MGNRHISTTFKWGRCHLGLLVGATLATTTVAFVILAQPQASTPTLLIQSDVDCTFAVDDGVSESIKAGVIRRIPTTLGEHLVTATTIDRKDRWKTVVNADQPIQKVVVIELLKVRAAPGRGAIGRPPNWSRTSERRRNKPRRLVRLPKRQRLAKVRFKS